MHRHGEDLQIGEQGQDVLDQLDPIAGFERDIRDQYGRPRIGNQAQSRRGVIGFTAYAQIWIPIDHGAQARPGNGMILYDKYCARFCFRAGVRWTGCFGFSNILSFHA